MRGTRIYSASENEINIVLEDLEYLTRDWLTGDVKDDEIRRSGTVLRRLTYRDLIKVWVSVVGQKDIARGTVAIEATE